LPLKLLKKHEATRARLLSELLYEYGEERMLIALRELSKWWEDNPNDL
jgi:hypothetical protein